MSGIREFDDLAKTFRSMEKALSNSELSKIVKPAANPILVAAKAAAPKDTGTLADGIILHKERSRFPGKVVYDVYMDPKKNGIFQKPILQPVRSKIPYAYYPASQEHGFFTRRSDGGMTYTRPDGSVAGMSKVPGKHFMRTGAEVSGEAAKLEIADKAIAAVEKAFGG